MQIVLERGSTDKPLTSNIGLLHFIFHILVCSPNTYACNSVFNPNIPIFVPNSAEVLHFSAFHYNNYYYDLLFCYGRLENGLC